MNYIKMAQIFQTHILRLYKFFFSPLIKSILFTGILIFYNYIVVYLHGTHISDFLGSTFVSILIAVFSITVSSIISLGKNLSELVIKYGSVFENTFRQLKTAIMEFLLVLSLFFICISFKTNILVIDNIFWLIGINTYMTYSLIQVFQIIFDVATAHFRLFESIHDIETKLCAKDLINVGNKNIHN